jgi:hypothetical protein
MADLITVDDVLACRELAALATRADIGDLMSAVSRRIERRAGRCFGLAYRIATLDGKGLPRLYLPARPIVSINSVTIGGIEVENTGGDAWTFDADTGRIELGAGRSDGRFAGRFPRGSGNVVIAYTGGLDPVPADIKQAALALLKFVVTGKRHSGQFISGSLGDESYELAPIPSGKLPGSVEMWLNGYHNFVM